MNTDTIKEIVKKNATLTTLKPYLRKYVYLEYSYKDIVPIALKMLYSQKRYKGKTINNSIRQVLEHAEITIKAQDRFIYPLDINKTVLSSSSIMGNMTVDYESFINNGFEQLLGRITDKNSDFYCDEVKCVDNINAYIDRIIQVVSGSKLNNKEDIVNSFLHMKKYPAASFYEAIQRVLFLNALLWQTGHRLMGLGRMDKYLIDLYRHDINSNKLSKEEAREYLEEMFNILHRNYWFKSDSLPGDTGQIVILGGLDENGDNLCNELTMIILDIFSSKTTPDPKLLLRVNSKTPDIVWDKAEECLLKQTGSPLFANDDVIIDCLCNSGIDKADAYEYATSACWEPSIVGKSFDQNNIDSLNLMEPFCCMINEINIEKLHSFDELLENYKTFLHSYLVQFIKRLGTIKWEKDPIISLFSESSCSKSVDISCGGAKYYQYGVTTTGIPNLVNNMLLLKDKVFKERKYTIKQLENERHNNWANKTFRKKIKNEASYFGKDDDEVINLTNKILKLISKELDNVNHNNIPPLKFGLSSPAYVMKAKALSATYDGKRENEPLIPHISGMGLAYTEIINFASQLDYSSGRHNGNVIDLFMTANEISDNPDKFRQFLKASVQQGFFELQMNVQDSQTLIAAKKEPEKYPNLIVRVWGFSAYFKDLPESYQDVLIQRAIDHEKMIA